MASRGARVSSPAYHSPAPSTPLRRAVTVLCERGTINKSYGCVYTTSKRKFMPFHLRASLNTEAKKEACRYAAQLIQENDIIYLDSGSTTCYILDYVSNLKS